MSGGGICCPVVIRGRHYPSQKAAAQALGVTPATVNDALNRGTIDRVGLGRAAASAVPVTIRGRRYASQTEAARALGVSLATVWRARRRGTLDRVGLAGAARQSKEED